MFSASLNMSVGVLAHPAIKMYLPCALESYSVIWCSYLSLYVEDCKVRALLMSSTSQVKFRLNLKAVGFPGRLVIVSILGVGATAIVLSHNPNPFAMIMVLLSVLLIIVLIYIIYPFVNNARLGTGMAISWYACMLVPASIYLMLPWLEIQVSDQVFQVIDREVTRIYLWVMGLFVIPIVLGLEQLIFAQSEVQLLEKESEVADLDFRIRPHFLFNSLNSVASLIAVDPVRAEEGLMDLSDMFRIILTDKRKLVPFSAEYEMAYKYMALEKMRLGERLEDDWQINSIDETSLLPALTLQPLLENAIYHGIETRLKGGKVSIKARQSKLHLYITIINPKPEDAMPVRKGNQIARDNLDRRFQHLYKGRGTINYVETDNYYTVMIKVPRQMEIE